MPRLPVNQPYTITTEFGVPDSNALFGKHSGVDFAVPHNRPIHAPASGSLTNIVSPTGGNMVVIYDGKYWHRLMHNSSFSRGNGHVNEGEEVAKAGTTGLSTGVHCHWDVNNQGTYPTSFAAFIDSMEYIKQGDEMSQATVEEIFKNLDAINKRLDKDEDVFNLLDATNKRVQELYALLDQTNKRLDKLEGK